MPASFAAGAGRCGRPDDILSAMRFFNTEGPVVAEDHYCIPPLERIDHAEVLELIRRKRNFVLHAPRQTGKTSALLALQDLLNSGGAGDYRCVYVNVEAAQAVREDVGRAMRVILGEMGDSALSGSSPATRLCASPTPSTRRWCPAS